MFIHGLGWCHLVALGRDHDDHLKVLSLAEGHVSDLLLRLPASILTAVEHHLVPAVEAGVEVQGDVAGLGLAAEQVDEEPAGSIKEAEQSPEATVKLVRCWRAGQVQTEQVEPQTNRDLSP